MKDLYTVVAAVLNHPNSTALRCRPLASTCWGSLRWASTCGMAFSSGFQSMGLRHPQVHCQSWVALGKAFSVVVPVLFSAIVVYLYITQA